MFCLMSAGLEQNKILERACSCEEYDARRLERLQDDHDTSRRTRVIPVVDRSNSPFYIIAVGTAEVAQFASLSGPEEDTQRSWSVTLLAPDA